VDRYHLTLVHGRVEKINDLFRSYNKVALVHFRPMT
jgi:hypothetical protein